MKHRGPYFARVCLHPSSDLNPNLDLLPCRTSQSPPYSQTCQRRPLKTWRLRLVFTWDSCVCRSLRPSCLCHVCPPCLRSATRGDSIISHASSRKIVAQRQVFLQAVSSDLPDHLCLYPCLESCHVCPSPCPGNGPYLCGQSPDNVPAEENLSVHSGHPSPCVYRASRLFWGSSSSRKPNLKTHKIQSMYLNIVIKYNVDQWSGNQRSIMTFTTDLPSMSKGLFRLRRSCSYRSCSCCRRSSSRSLMILSCSRRLSYSIRNLSRSKNWRSIRSASRRSFSNWKIADVLEASFDRRLESVY